MSRTRQQEIDEIRERAENDLKFFIKLVAPHRVLGAIHEELVDWWTREDGKDHQLVLLPRDHQKSAMIAYRVAWQITRDPTSTFLYISSASRLAEKQLFFIKNILTSKVYRRFWPEMVHADEAKRTKWTNNAIIVDHPDRTREGIRDDTITTAGLTTSITGLHFTHAVLDDIVVKENAYTEEGRNKVASQYSLLSSIESTGTDEDASGAQEWVVGTRYHPRDLYGDLISMEYDVYNKEGDKIGTNQVYEVFQREVEDRGDGTGEFLWPRQQSSIGKWFGFDINILAKKRAKYVDKTQFRAQYYNNPNDPDNEKIARRLFQYYDRNLLKYEGGRWIYHGERLNVFAAIDFAFSLKKKADYTAVVVLGVDAEHNYYVLDIERFKTDMIKTYFDKILELHEKWGFRKIRAEVTAAQEAISKELKNSYIKPYGLKLSIDEYRPSRHEGTKEERMMATLKPRYENLQVWHYKGGNCQSLEEELVMANPPHDDIADALTAAMDIAVAPSDRGGMERILKNKVVYHPRFGGVVR